MPATGVAPTRSLPTTIEPLFMVQRRAIIEALRTTRGNIDGAAYGLQVSRNTVYRKMRAFEIREEEYMS